MVYGSFFCFLAGGILFVLYSHTFQFTVVMAAGIFLSSLGIVLLRLEIPGYKKAGLFCLAFTLGMITGIYLHLYNQYTEQNWYKAYRDITSFSGHVYKDSAYSGSKGYIHYVQIDNVRSETKNYRTGGAGRAAVFVSGSKRYYTGQLLDIRGKLQKPENSGETHFTCYTTERSVTEKGFKAPVYQIRYNMLQALSMQINELGYPAAGLFNALFLGTKEDLPDELVGAFQNTGTLHILALSGLHVGIIYLLISLLLFPLPGKRVKLLAGSVLVLFYLFLVGPVASLQRAAFMLILMAVTQFLYRTARPLNLLALSACIILICDPRAAYSVSFQLSFLAMTGILLAGARLTKLFPAYIPRIFMAPLVCSLGAQLATAPVVFANFQVAYPSGIIVTLLLVPIVTVFMWTAILFLVLSVFQVPVISYAGSQVMNLLYSLISAITQFFSGIPGLFLQWRDEYWLVFLAVMFPFLIKIKRKPRAMKSVPVSRLF